GGKPKVKREHAYRTYAIRICEGPIAGVLRVWEDDKLVYDVRPESPIVAESSAWIANKTIYLGDEDQLPDPVLQAQVSGASDTPAYRGTAYIVVDSEDLTERRGSIPQYRFEIASAAETVPLDTIPTDGAAGTTGGGGLPEGASISIYLDDVNAGPGEAWLVYIVLRSTIGAQSVPYQANIDGNVFFQGVASIDDEWTVLRTQLNHVSDHSLLTVGFGGPATVGYQLGVAKI